MYNDVPNKKVGKATFLNIMPLFKKQVSKTLIKIPTSANTKSLIFITQRENTIFDILCIGKLFLRSQEFF